MSSAPSSAKRWIIIFILSALVCYSLFQARFIIWGPRVSIDVPTNGEVLDDPLVNISGTAKNISFISLNGRQIYTDESGHWSETLIAPKGPSIMTIDAKDRFGREVKKTVEVVVN